MKDAGMKRCLGGLRKNEFAEDREKILRGLIFMARRNQCTVCSSAFMTLLQPPFVIATSLALALPWGGPAAAGEATGTITGTLPLPATTASRIAVEKYSGSISGKVGPPQPVVAGVWLERSGLVAPANPPRLSLNQKDYQFRQSLVVIPRGTTVDFPNEDQDYHNVYSLSKGAKFDLGRYKKDAAPPPSVTFESAGLIRLKCEIHEHMRAVILVVDSPYYAATDAAGQFTLKNIPPGQYTLHAQVDEKNRWSTPVSVTAGRPTTATFPTANLASTSAR